MSDAGSVPPTFRALLVGCGYYFPNRLPNGATYQSLDGCIHDIDRVAAMLRSRIEGPLVITRLAASNTKEGPPEPQSEWPTAANLLAALEGLAESARRGDQIYFHYSGHGGRVVSCYAKLKGSGVVDEALVPIDVGGEEGIDPSRYLRDVQLAGIMTRIAAKIEVGTPGGGMLMLCLDCCHSGGETRGVAPISLRRATGGVASTGDVVGTLDTTQLDLVDERPAAVQAKRAWAALQRDADLSRGVNRGAKWLPPSGSYVLLAACRDTEAAIEAELDGGVRGGVMTDAFLEALHSLAGAPSWVTVYNRVLARVLARYPSQTPQLLGDPARRVFGVELRPLPPTAPVLEVDATARQVRVGAGLATLIGPGMELGIFRPDTIDFSVAAAQVATATVTSALAAECWATLDAAAQPDRIELGAPAIPLKMVLQRKVALFQRDDLPQEVAVRQEAALSAVAEELERSGRGFLVAAAAGEMPDYQVVITERAEYEIWDPRGVAIPYMTPALRLDPAGGVTAGGAAARVVDRLVRLTRYHTVLEMISPPSALDRSVDVELLAAPRGWTEQDAFPAQPLPPLVREGDVYAVRDGRAVFIRVTNSGSQAINVAAIDLFCTWEIELLVPPSETGAQSEVIGPGESRMFPIWFFVPPELGSTRDVIKVFAAIGNAPFSSLKQPSLDAPFATRGTTRGCSANALGRLFDAFDAERNTMRHARPAVSNDLAWTVRTFYLLVK